MNDLQQAVKDGLAPWNDTVYELTDYHVAVFRDKYPVTPGHLLFVPQYNTDAVIEECFRSALNHGRTLMYQGHCDGFNIGLNIGTSAGQTVMYPHVHLIPRKKDDCQDPVGGVRNVIPGKGNYKKNV